ncbi:MAG: carboxypeptidase regulatory-like domain-containing protein, partial [Acidobacteriaceae bacterium]|nr:carboxypeptidase regulatory-like domain-containing protein [Acidobacteriaceae bacterium]
MNRPLRRLLLSSILLVLASAIPVFAQTFGEITGHISDATGASVAGAQVALTFEATNAVRTTVSSDSGDYTFPSVPPGVYTIKVEKTSFKAETSSHVEVQVEQSVRLDFTLVVGQVTESVQVSAQAEMLQAEDESLGTVIDNKGVTELPLNGRNYLSL